MHFADSTVANKFASTMELSFGALLAAGLPYYAIPFYCVADGPAFVDSASEGLLSVDVQTGAGGSDGGNGVPLVWKRELDGIEVTTTEQFSKIQVCLTVTISIFFVHDFLGPVAMISVDVADGQHLDFSVVEETAHITRTHRAYSDGTHYDAITGSNSAGFAECR
jgi:hypothetical protein